MVRINLLPVRVSKKKEAGKQQLLVFAAVLVWTGSKYLRAKRPAPPTRP